LIEYLPRALGHIAKIADGRRDDIQRAGNF
jgi:hypothetical protein